MSDHEASHHHLDRRRKTGPESDPTISACLIVKDEASVLERCLASLEGAADEVIVVDTGSTDSTKEIAAKYRGRLISRQESEIKVMRICVDMAIVI